MVGINFNPWFVKTISVNHVKTMYFSLVYGLAFHKADETLYTPSDKEKKAMFLLRYVDDVKDPFQHVRGVTDTYAFSEAVKKINDKLGSHSNIIV